MDSLKMKVTVLHRSVIVFFLSQLSSALNWHLLTHRLSSNALPEHTNGTDLNPLHNHSWSTWACASGKEEGMGLQSCYFSQKTETCNFCVKV